MERNQKQNKASVCSKITNSNSLSKAFTDFLELKDFSEFDTNFINSINETDNSKNEINIFIECYSNIKPNNDLDNLLLFSKRKEKAEQLINNLKNENYEEYKNIFRFDDTSEKIQIKFLKWCKKQYEQNNFLDDEIIRELKKTNIILGQKFFDIFPEIILINSKFKNIDYKEVIIKLLNEIYLNGIDEFIVKYKKKENKSSIKSTILNTKRPKIKDEKITLQKIFYDEINAEQTGKLHFSQYPIKYSNYYFYIYSRYFYVSLNYIEKHFQKYKKFINSFLIEIKKDVKNYNLIDFYLYIFTTSIKNMNIYKELLTILNLENESNINSNKIKSGLKYYIDELCENNTEDYKNFNNINLNSDYFEKLNIKNKEIPKIIINDSLNLVKIFNNDFVKILKLDKFNIKKHILSFDNFENELYKNLLFEYNKDENYYMNNKDIYEISKSIVRRLLKTPLIKSFFKFIFPNYSYLYENEDILDFLFSRIKFYPFFEFGYLGIFEPWNFEIWIKSFPPKIYMEIYNYKISKLIIICYLSITLLHEFSHLYKKILYYYDEEIAETTIEDISIRFLNNKRIKEGDNFLEIFLFEKDIFQINLIIALSLLDIRNFNGNQIPIDNEINIKIDQVINNKITFEDFKNFILPIFEDYKNILPELTDDLVDEIINDNYRKHCLRTEYDLAGIYSDCHLKK